MSENSDEIVRLNKQLDKVLDAIGIGKGVNAPCPSDVGLSNIGAEDHCSNCRECWDIALAEVE